MSIVLSLSPFFRFGVQNGPTLSFYVSVWSSFLSSFFCITGWLISPSLSYPLPFRTHRPSIFSLSPKLSLSFAACSTLCSILSERASLFLLRWNGAASRPSRFLALSLSLLSVPFVSMQPPSVRDGSAGHGELERRARTAMFTRFRWCCFFVEHDAFLSVHAAAILIMPAAGRVTTCAPWFFFNSIVVVVVVVGVSTPRVSFRERGSWERERARAWMFVVSELESQTRCGDERKSQASRCSLTNKWFNLEDDTRRWSLASARWRSCITVSSWSSVSFV